MRMKENTVVSSQNMYIARVLSVVTRPSMAPAKLTKAPAKRPRPAADAEKYRVV